MIYAYSTGVGVAHVDLVCMGCFFGIYVLVCLTRSPTSIYTASYMCSAQVVNVSAQCAQESSRARCNFNPIRTSRVNLSKYLPKFEPEKQIRTKRTESVLVPTCIERVIAYA